MRQRVERFRRVSDQPGGAVTWMPELEPVRAVILKNARGHAMFEYGEPMRDEPASVAAVPLVQLTDEQRADFENVAIDVWPEVGSRMMTRIATGQDLADGWVIVQPGIYRYAVTQDGLMTVRIVMFEYLAAEVRWD